LHYFAVGACTLWTLVVQRSVCEKTEREIMEDDRHWRDSYQWPAVQRKYLQNSKPTKKGF